MEMKSFTPEEFFFGGQNDVYRNMHTQELAIFHITWLGPRSLERNYCLMDEVKRSHALHTNIFYGLLGA